MRYALSFLAAVVLLLPALARGDELKLKDGSIIVGTIVAFEENSFKVQTSYGFAIVQKNQVAAARERGKILYRWHHQNKK